MLTQHQCKVVAYDYLIFSLSSITFNNSKRLSVRNNNLLLLVVYILIKLSTYNILIENNKKYNAITS